MKTIAIILGLSIISFFSVEKIRPNILYGNPKIGDAIDSLNNVLVYYNDHVSTVVGRNVHEGYNIGLKYQCVEFVKRYYYEYYNHKMPDSYGHALSFFNTKYKDGELNKERNLFQYSNPSISKPQVGDLIIMDATLINSYGHVAIISAVNDTEIEIIQQNPGPYEPSRESFKTSNKDNSLWKIDNERILGWLRMQGE